MGNGIVTGVYKPLKERVGHVMALDLAQKVKYDLMDRQSTDYTTPGGSFRVRGEGKVDRGYVLTWF